MPDDFSEEAMEARLRAAHLPGPGPGLRGRILTRCGYEAARIREGRRRKGLLLRWGFAASLLFLLSLNAWEDRRNEARLAQIFATPTSAALARKQNESDLHSLRNRMNMLALLLRDSSP